MARVSYVLTALIDWDYPLAGTNLFSYGTCLSTVSQAGRLALKVASQFVLEKMEISWEKEQYIYLDTGLL